MHNIEYTVVSVRSSAHMSKWHCRFTCSLGSVANSYGAWAIFSRKISELEVLDFQLWHSYSIVQKAIITFTRERFTFSNS